MLLLLNSVIGIVVTIDVTKFDNFKLLFDPECKEYFLFNGTNNYAYFYQRNGNFELWLSQNATNYSIFTTKNDTNLLFDWAGPYVNHQMMDLVLHEGHILQPMNFHSTQYLCDVNGVIAGDILDLCPLESYEKSVPLSYKCKCRENWVLISAITVSTAVVALILLFSRNESVQIIFRSKFSRIIQWCRQILSGSQEAISKVQCDEEESPTNSPQIGALLNS